MSDFLVGFIIGIFFCMILTLVILAGGNLFQKDVCKQVSKKPYCYKEWVAYDEVKK